MDSSEHDDLQETLSPPADPAEPQAGHEVAPEAPAPVASQEPEPPLEPLEPAEPGVYYYDVEGDAGTHPVLGNLLSGENDFSEETHPEKLMAIAAMVRDGVLTKMNGQADVPAYDSSQR